ncbi:MAG TPA: DNA repair protein RecN [Puia sp.]|nr:DNA repair protein RecN [Puia sp.]
MLKQLRIQNYAIIDDVSIDFSDRLNIITGETGAGKSILTGATALILGARADTSMLLNREKKCLVEAVFESGDKNTVKQFLRENDLDAEDELVIRREIGSNGKSRAFVNDTPVNLEQLHELGLLLVDLHQQFDSLELGESGFQLKVLDALAGHGELLNEYQDVYQQWAVTKRDWRQLQEQQLLSDKESDYNRFLYGELEEANFGDHELEMLDNDLKLLNNAEGIKTMLAKLHYELEESEASMVQGLKSLSQQLQAYATFQTELPKIQERLLSTQIELKDIAEDVDRINNHIQYDPARMEEISERLATGYKLLKKHGLRSTQELLDLKGVLEKKLQAGIDITSQLAEKEKEAEGLFHRANSLAGTLSTNRKAQTASLEKKVNALLAQVGMPNARLRVRLQAGELNSAGMDTVEFLFDANKSGRFEPVRKVASGGELSRLMLCIKSLVAQSMDLPTLIFDEIDTGISGEAARQVGIILKGLAEKRQVVCITHQPQIAGKADAHYFVYKEMTTGMIRTQIRLLSRDERITTIAKMLSGEKPTAAAMENAREMLMH